MPGRSTQSLEVIVESGTMLGVAASATLILAQVGVVRNFSRRTPLWSGAAIHAMALSLICVALWGLTYVLAVGLNVTDSSHGFMSVGLPAGVAVIGAAIGILVIVAIAASHSSSQSTQR